MSGAYLMERSLQNSIIYKILKFLLIFQDGQKLWINQEKLLTFNINQFAKNKEDRMKNLKYLNGIKVS